MNSKIQNRKSEIGRMRPAVAVVFACFLAITFLFFLALGVAFALPGLTLQKGAPSSVASGDTFTYFITLTNSPTADAIGVVLTDRLPSGVQLKSGSISDNGIIQNGVISWIVDVPKNTAASRSFQVVATQAGTVSNDDYHADYDNGSVHVDGSPVTTQIAPGPPAQATVGASPITIPADGLSSAVITATVQDAYGNPVADGTPVNVTASSGTLSGSPPGTWMTVNGQVSGFLTAPTTVGQAVVSVQGLTTQNATVTFVPGPPATASIAANPKQLVADGSSTALLTITVKDAHGNLVADGTAITVTTTAGTVNGSSTTSNGMTTRQLVAASDITTATLAVAGLTTTGDTSFPFTVGPPASATVVANPTSVTADGSDAATLTITLRDAGGHLVADDTGATVTTDLGTVSGSGKTVNGVLNRTLTSTAIGTATISVVGVSTTGDTVTFVPGPLDHVTIAPHGTVNVPVDQPQQFTAQGEDAYNNPIGGLTYSWGFDLGGDGAGNIDAGGLFTGTSLGTVYVIAVANGVKSGAVSAHVVPGSPAQAVVSASPKEIVANNKDQSLLLITIRDIQGNLVGDGTNPVVTSTLGTILGVDGTAGGVAQRALRAGSTVGTAHVYVDGFAATGDTVTLLPGPPAKAMIVATPSSIPANGVATTTLSITLRDQYDNLVSDGNTAVLVTDQGTLQGCNQVTTVGGVMTCTLQSNTTIGTATVQAPALQTTGGKVNFVVGTLDHITIAPSETQTTTAGSSLHFSAQGYDAYEVPLPDLSYVWTKFKQDGDGEIDSNGNFVGTQAGIVLVRASVGQVFSNLVTVHVVAGNSSTAYVQASPTTITADGVSTSTLTITLYDPYGNLVPDGTWVTVSSSLGSISGSGTTVSGMLQRTLHAGTSTGTATIGVSGNVTVTGDTVRILAGPAATAVVVVDPYQLPADGVSQSSLSITLRDAFGNLVEEGTVVTTTTNLGSISGSSGTANGVMARTFTAGTTLGTARIDVGGLPTTGGTIYLVPGPPDHAGVQASPTSLVADGSSLSTLTITVYDVQEHRVTTGIPITVTSNLGSVEGTGSTIDGQVTRYLRAGTTLGTAALTVETPDKTLPVAGDMVQFIVGPARKATVGASPAQVPADGASISVLTITAMDNYTHTVPDGTVLTVTTDIGSLTGSGTTQNGSISRVFHAGTVAGTPQIQVTSDDGALEIGGDTLVVTPGPLAHLRIAPDAPPDIAAGTQTTLTVTATDAYSNEISSLAIQWILTPETGSGLLTPVGNGQSAVFSAGSPGILRLQASSGGVSSNSVTLTVVPGPPAKAHIQATPHAIVANSTNVSTLRVTVTDAYDNPVGNGFPVTVTTNLGTVYGTGNTVEGIVTRYLSSTVSGLASIEVAGLLPVGDITVTVQPGPAAKAIISASPSSILADGVSTSTLTIAIQDAFGNPVADGVSVQASTTLGILSGSGNTANGETQRVLQSSTTVGTADIQISGLQTTGGQVNFIPGPPATGLVSAWPLDLVADGMTSSVLTMTVRDTFGHLVADGTNLIITSTLGRIYGDSLIRGGTITRTLRSSTAGRATISSPGLIVTGDDVVFKPGPMSTAEVIASSKTVPADGNSMVLLSIYVRDGQGNPVFDGTPLTVHSSIGTLSIYGTGASVGGVITRTLVSTVAGTALITVDDAITTGDNAIIFTPGPPTQAEIHAWPNTLVADGMSTSALTVTLHDGLGNLVADDTPVTVRSSLGLVLGSSTTKRGVVTRTLRADINLGTVTFTVDGIGQDKTGSRVYLIPGSPAKAWITATPDHLANDGISKSSLHIAITDPYDHPVTDGLRFSVTTTFGSLFGDTPTTGGEIVRSLQSTTTVGTAYLSVAGLPAGGSTAIPIQKMVLNGDFETGNTQDWIVGGVLPITLTQGDLFAPHPFSGQYMILLGTPSLHNEGHPVGSAYMFQPMHVPAGVPSILSLWYRMFSYDVLYGTRYPLWDSFDLKLRDGDGNPITLIRREGYGGQYQGQLWDSGWRQVLFDLTPWAGQDVQLHLELANRNEPRDDSWVYVDQIEIKLLKLRRIAFPLVLNGGSVGFAAMDDMGLQGNK